MHEDADVVAPRMAAISSMESARARMTRDARCDRASSNPRGVGTRHLRGGVQRKIGSHGADQAGDDEILHDDGIDPRRCAGAHGLLKSGEIVSAT